MAITLWNLFEASLLVLNAICVLHEERFLAKIGWTSNAQHVQGFGESPSAKTRIITLIYSIRTVMRFPLVIVNILTLIVKLLFG